MTKQAYLKELRERLARLPLSERDEAVQFFEEYFEDAQDDAAAIEALGSPARQAAQITAEYSARMLDEKQQAQKVPPQEPAPFVNNLASMTPPPQGYTRQSYKPGPAGAPPQGSSPSGERFAAAQAPPQGYTQQAYAQSLGAGAEFPQNQAMQSPYAGDRSDGSLRLIWNVLLGIVSLIAAFPLAIVALVFIIVVISVCFALIVALFAVVAALIGAGGYVLFSGAVITGWASGLIAVGTAVILLGLALLLIPLLIKFSIWLVRTIGNWISRIFKNMKERSTKHEKQ